MLNQQFKKTNFSLIWVVVVGLFLTFLSAYQIRQWELQQAIHAKQMEVDKYIRALRQSHDNLRDLFRSIKSMQEIEHKANIDTNKKWELDQNSFHHFVKRHLEQERKQSLDALAWVPVVTHDKMLDFEQRMNREKAFQEFQIWEHCSGQASCKVLPRDIYYPIQFIENIKEHQSKLGFNLSSNIQLDQALSKARDEANLMVTVLKEPKDFAYLYMFYPLYDYDTDPPTAVTRQMSLRGFIVGFFNIENYLEETLRPSRYNPNNFLQIFDTTDSQNPVLLYRPQWLAKKAQHAQDIQEILPQVPVSLEFGGRQWSIKLYRIPSIFDFQYWYSVGAFCVGLFLTFGFWRYLLLALNRAVWAETLVEQRTQSLQTANLALQQEMEMTRRITEQLDASRRQFRAIFDEAGIGIVQTNLEHIILENNKAVHHILGYGSSELQGRALHDFVHPADLDSDKQLLNGLLMGDYDSYRISKRYLRRNGETVWTHLNCSIVRDPLKPFLISMVEDVTERHFAELARLEAEKKFRKIFENAIEGIFQCTFSGHFISVNPAFLKIFGCDNADILYQKNINLKRQLHEHPACYEDFMRRLTSNREIKNFEYQARCFDGRIIWVAETVRIAHDEQGQNSFYEGFIEDITHRKAVEEKLRYDATHDQLTGLLNRSAFTHHLERGLARLKEKEKEQEVQMEKMLPFAVLFVDLDRFKMINDSMGHLVGDQLLEEIAHRLRRETRGCDVVARFGGDEFALMLENMSSIKALEDFIERLNRCLGESYTLQNEVFNTTASIGIALANVNYNSADELLRDADIAMYEAKRQGRGKAVFFQSGMHVQVLNIMRMESDLRKAFERGEFCLFYQPIISLENRHTVSLEALLRWNHPEKGLISPDKFIPLAEDTGLIRELGLWVFEQACYQLKYWQVRFPHHHNLGVNINVSAIQLKQPRLVREIETIIHRSGLKPDTCRMEITESAMMNDPDLMLNVLKDLKGLEVQLYIDDFGTGYSSLSYLQKFPIDALKIDKSFIQNIDASDKSMQIAQAIIALGNAFDLRVVAEGVETDTQLNILEASHCHHVQGYYFSRPIDKEKTENYLSIIVH
ncbi:bifunctional diguanylate cyclase/phosphodiesterase [Thioflexithrix psekupsensis]|uniref:cyclic-guanylate-specific phosphodiesterase n=1 Tax=Thioflexithrix psekupsensis TaxID=1570016 RepID=A0A251X4U8_9GAMM|nr:EAL domain-containing protein [Thioflexithrix psekupsensis]OUD12524.1 hypothetical protein TPSD3_15655 [Thioflexithrix psekupsensis]